MMYYDTPGVCGTQGHHNILGTSLYIVHCQWTFYICIKVERDGLNNFTLLRKALHFERN